MKGARLPEDRTLVEYWFASSALCDRLIEFTSFMREWADEVPTDGPRNILRERAQELRELSMKAPIRLRRGRPANGGQHQGPQLIDETQVEFLAAFKLLKEELKPRLLSFPPSSDRRAIEDLLKVDVHTLAMEFGSLSAAWDYLVDLKYQVSIPDPRLRKRDAWFTEVVEHAERFVREIIGVAVLHVGRSLILPQLLACLEDPGLDIFPASAKQLAKFSSTSDVLADTVVGYMDRDSKNTTVFAAQFGRSVGAPLFLAQPGIERGLLSKLPHGRTVQEAWMSLLSVRRAIVHTTPEEHLISDPVDVHEFLYELNLNELKLVADFLGAFCFDFAVRLMVRIVDMAAEADRGTPDVLRYLLAGQLRVLLKRLLTQERYELAWAVAESALKAEPEWSPGTMVKLNAFLARQRLGERFFDVEEVAALDVGDLPRYKLIKQILLGERDRVKLERLLDDAISSGDVSMPELHDWPALTVLWRTSWFGEWLKRYDEGDADRR